MMMTKRQWFAIDCAPLPFTPCAEASRDVCWKAGCCPSSRTSCRTSATGPPRCRSRCCSKAFFRTVSHASHQWLSPTAAALVEALLVARVASLPALRAQWQQQPRWLLPQILPWCVKPHSARTLSSRDSTPRVPSSCFCVSATRCAFDHPRRRRYSKLHRDIIKRAWPPALDARAPVQVRWNSRD
jgi:hypothetical protein